MTSASGRRAASLLPLLPPPSPLPPHLRPRFPRRAICVLYRRCFVPGGKSRRDIIFRTLRFFASTAHGEHRIIYAPRASAFIKPKYFKTRVKERKARAAATLAARNAAAGGRALASMCRFCTRRNRRARENRQLLLRDKRVRGRLSLAASLPLGRAGFHGLSDTAWYYAFLIWEKSRLNPHRA